MDADFGNTLAAGAPPEPSDGGPAHEGLARCYGAEFADHRISPSSSLHKA
jgi:hypothetical protein